MKVFALLLLLLWMDKEGACAMQGCGSVDNNTLKSPGYPNNYPRDMDCSYRIPIPHNMTINISFIDFELDSYSPCRYDYLEIVNDGRMVGKYCGQKTGKNILLIGDEILIKFYSDSSREKRGFRIYFNAGSHAPAKVVSDPVVRVELGYQVQCSAIGVHPIHIALIQNFTVLMNTTNTASSKLYQEGNYTCVATNKYGTDVKHFVIKACGPAIENTLRSPGYPNDYPKNTDCFSSLPIPQGMVINITINELYLEDSITCDRDYLQITNEKNQVFGKYCGHKTGKNVIVSGKYAWIKFHSDSSVQNRRFLIKFSAVAPPSFPEPVAFYPLNEHYKAAEKENRQPEGILGDVAITNGPYNEPGGAYMFYGTISSYITFPNIGGLDTRFSITLMCWVQPGGQDGPLFGFQKREGQAFQIWIKYSRFTLIFQRKDGEGFLGALSNRVPPTGSWVHVAATYDNNTAQSSLFFNGHFRATTHVPTSYGTLTNTDDARMGAMQLDPRYFNGKIAKMKIYDVALNEAQIQRLIIQVPPTVQFPAAVLAIKGGMLSCSARGSPPRYTALIQNSRVLLNTTNTTTIRLDQDGNYTCQATNQYGTDVRELQVSFTTFGPEIGFLTSEGYPYSYPRNANIRSPAYPVPEGWSMNIYFQDFDVEESPFCSKDFLRITDGMDKIFGLYCGNKIVGQNLLVTGDQVEIIFHSDGEIERRGYLLNFTLVSSTLVPVSHVPTDRNSGQTQESSISSEKMIYISSGIAFILLLVLCFILRFWCRRRSNHKRIKRSARSAREIIPLDKWELLPEQIEHKEELGRGAFGVVYKATLKRRVGIEMFDTEKTLKPEEPCQVVAVKELQNDPSEDQKEEFLQEIEQMKLLGAHQNIVSLVGCCTLQKHKFLVIEYVPFGDLLQWLRRRRLSINRNQGTEGKEEKKCYEDKETFNDKKEISEYGQGEQDPQNENRALVIPSSFRVDKEITMFSGQLLQGKSNHLLDQENIELMPITSTSQGNSNAAAILISSEDDEEKENSFLNQQSMKIQLTHSTPQKNSNVSAILTSVKNIDGDDNVEDDDDDDDGKVLLTPSTLQGNSNARPILISTENINDDGNDDNGEEADGFTSQKLFSFAWQIGKGMNHLAEKGFVHRDLAARNILVGSDNRVKVSDFGLMREIYEDVYSGKNTKKLPVKWMAPESIHDSIYTTKSDVWSFGILLYEMATMGGVPYPTLTNGEVCRLLKTGYRMERPDMCCDELYELMYECWNEDPSSRPSFSELVDRMEVIMTRDVPYCDLDKHDESRPV